MNCSNWYSKRATFALLITFAAGAIAQPLPTAPPAGYDHPNQHPAGTVHWNVSYYSSVAGRDLTMNVYTPPGYDPDQKHGVIYCYQGITDKPFHVFNDTHIRAHIVADNLIGQGLIQPVIIVALDDQYNGTSNSNVEDMTIQDALPYVDSHYSTYANANNRGVYGYSWGGGYAFNVGMENLDVFRHVAPTAAAPNKHPDTTLFADGGTEAKRKLRSLFFSWGEYDYDIIVSDNRAARQYCIDNGIPHYSWEIAEGWHWSEPVWRPALWNFLQMADRAGISSASHDLPPLDMEIRDDAIALQWDSTHNILYSLESSPDLEEWLPLPGSDVLGDGSFVEREIELADDIAPRFFRLTQGSSQ